MFLDEKILILPIYIKEAESWGKNMFLKTQAARAKLILIHSASPLLSLTEICVCNEMLPVVATMKTKTKSKNQEEYGCSEPIFKIDSFF